MKSRVRSTSSGESPSKSVKKQETNSDSPSDINTIKRHTVYHSAKHQINEIFKTIKKLPKPVGTAKSEGNVTQDNTSAPSTDTKHSQKNHQKPPKHSQRSRKRHFASDGFTNGTLQPKTAVRKQTADGLSLYTIEELNIGKGGKTPLCPFDCHCCF